MSNLRRQSAEIDAAVSSATISKAEEPGKRMRLDRTISNPGAVKFNVEGAFIVDDEANAKNGVGPEGIHYEHKDIRLPHHTGVVSHVAVDVSRDEVVCTRLKPTDVFIQQIGGSLAKLVYFSREPRSADGGGRLNFLNFETDRIDLCIDFIQQLKQKQQQLNGSNPAELCVMATGGGAYKYYDRMKEVLGVDVLREDEMECLIIGTAHVPYFCSK